MFHFALPNGKPKPQRKFFRTLFLPHKQKFGFEWHMKILISAFFTPQSLDNASQMNWIEWNVNNLQFFNNLSLWEENSCQVGSFAITKCKIILWDQWMGTFFSFRRRASSTIKHSIFVRIVVKSSFRIQINKWEFLWFQSNFFLKKWYLEMWLSMPWFWGDQLVSDIITDSVTQPFGNEIYWNFFVSKCVTQFFLWKYYYVSKFILFVLELEIETESRFD